MNSSADAGGRLAARLAARTAHDLNNLAAVLAGHVFLLRNAAEPTAEACEAIETSLAYLERLSKGLMTIGGLGAEEPVSVDLGEILRRAVEETGGRVELQTARLPSFRGRPRDIRAAIGALLANAREATPTGAPVRVFARIEANETVITVEDPGSGVDASVRQKNFDPFLSTKGEKGRGVGVTIARLVADLHGGSLDIEDRPEGGTRASLRLRADAFRESSKD